MARRHVEDRIHSLNVAATEDREALYTGDDFRRMLDAWWHFFEHDYKRNLVSARENKLLEKIGYLQVPGLIEVTESSSRNLARRTRGLVEKVIQDMRSMMGVEPTASLHGCPLRCCMLTRSADYLCWRLQSVAGAARPASRSKPTTKIRDGRRGVGACFCSPSALSH